MLGSIVHQRAPIGKKVIMAPKEGNGHINFSLVLEGKHDTLSTYSLQLQRLAITTLAVSGGEPMVFKLLMNLKFDTLLLKVIQP